MSRWQAPTTSRRSTHSPIRLAPMKLQPFEDGFHGLESPVMLESGHTRSKDIELSTSDALMVLRHDREHTRAVRRVPLPVIYFVFYIIMIASHIPANYLYKQNNALYTTLASSGDDTITSDSPMLFFNIATPSDVFSWIELSLVPSIFVTQDYNGNDLPLEEWGRIATHNQVLGAVRFTVTSGAMESCDNQKFLHSIYPTCYGTDAAFENVTLFSITLNSTEAVNNIKQLQADGAWIDASTQKLEITAVSYNAELSTYGVTNLKLEFEQGGFIDLSATTTGAKSTLYRSAQPFVSDALLVVCFLLVLGNQLVTLWRNRQCLGAHLRDFWYFIDYASSVLVVAFYVVWAFVFATTRDSSFRTNVDAFSVSNIDWTADDEAANRLDSIISSVEHIGHLTVALRLLATVTILFLGIRILDSFRFHPRLNMLSHTISRSLHKFGAFFVVFVVVVVTFSLSGHFIFGDHAKEFSSIKASLESCVNILFGNFDYAAIEGIYVPVSIIYYWGYLVIASLILLNMMLAIVLDTYEEVSEEAFNDKTITSIGRVMRIIWYDLLLWLHDLPRRGCFQRNKNASYPLDEGQENCDIPRRQVIFRGRIRPDVLETVFDALEAAGEKKATKASQKLSPLKLQSIFSYAQVTNVEARATMEYLLHDLTPLAPNSGEDTEDDGKTARSKKARRRQRDVGRSRSENSEAAQSPTPELGANGPWATFANTDPQQLTERMAAMEQKLELLLELMTRK